MAGRTTLGLVTAALIGLAVYAWALAPPGPVTVMREAPADAAPALRLARYGHTSVVLGRHLYVLGGIHGTRPTRDVERATIWPDGRLGPFTAVPGLALSHARAGHTSVVVGDRLYVIGGRDGAGFLGSVEQAIIGPDGELGSFSPVPGIDLATPRGSATGAVVGGHLYVMGGHGDGGILQSVERSAIDADGRIGPFASVAGLALGAPRTCHTGVAIGPSVYVLGGVDASGRILRSVERATLALDGTLGPFRRQGAALQTPRSTPSSLIADGFLYVIGGADNARTTFASIERAPVRPDGVLGAFAPWPYSLASPRSFHSSVEAHGSLYVLGGQDRHFLLTRDVERLRLK
ncbi:Kelch motif protein [compost metagenome]